MAGKILLKLDSDGNTTKSNIIGGEKFFKELLINKNSYIGKMATVLFQNYTPSDSLRFPRVKCIRDYE